MKEIKYVLDNVKEMFDLGFSTVEWSCVRCDKNAAPKVKPSLRFQNIHNDIYLFVYKYRSLSSK